VIFYNVRSKELIDRVERVAKIKFKRVGAPQPEDIMKATARDIAISLKMVSEDVLPYFSDIAAELIQEEGAQQALSKALALISGHT
jgi:ATP-dependent RNA helicase DDX21